MNVKLPSPLRLFEPAPLMPALGVPGVSGGHIMLSSNNGGGGRSRKDDAGSGSHDNYDDYDDYDYGYDEEPEERPRSKRTVRGRGSDTTGGRTVTSSYQPEERYWTDYLRIALPILGLLLLLGLLWFWATNLIGDKKDTTQPSDGTNVAVVRTSTPEPSEVPADLTATNTPASKQNNDTIGINNSRSESTPDAKPTQPVANNPSSGSESTPSSSGEGKSFKSQQAVTVTESDVNMRSEPSTSGSSVGMLKKGDELTIVSGPKEADGYVWWEVVDSAGNSGFVVEDFLEAADS